MDAQINEQPDLQLFPEVQLLKSTEMWVDCPRYASYKRVSQSPYTPSLKAAII